MEANAQLPFRFRLVYLGLMDYAAQNRFSEIWMVH